MLQANEEQRKHIEKMLGEYSDLMYALDDGIRVDSYISYDQIAAIVDYLRTSDKKDELFEECWKAYRRKGVKKPAKAQWQKLSDKEKESVLPHIKAYLATREVQYQKDFERYLRDRLFNEVVYGNNKIVYDPQKAASKEYMPSGHNVYYDELRGFYYYTGFYMRSNDIMDGYTDEERPDGAKLCLNNARGVIQWNADRKVWLKQK